LKKARVIAASVVPDFFAILFTIFLAVLVSIAIFIASARRGVERRPHGA
jgi:hypothetical protein